MKIFRNHLSFIFAVFLTCTFGFFPVHAQIIIEDEVVYITATVSAPSNPTEAGISFTGQAFPLASIIIERNSAIVATAIAGNSGNFSISMQNIPPGFYTYSVRAVDTSTGSGATSRAEFSVLLTSGVTTNISGISLSPTIALNKTTLPRNDTLNITGRAIPSSEVRFTVVNASTTEQFFYTVNANTSGAYLYVLNTTPLVMGNYTVTVRSFSGANLSPVSLTRAFAVSAELPTCLNIADVNCDRRVDLVDFSILAFWYLRSGFSSHLDLNSDGKIDLADFSVMAFYWTG